MATLAELIQAALDAPIAEEYIAQEKALQACVTAADWQAAYDAFGERTIAELVCQWADEASFGPAEGEGAAMIVIDDGSAIVAEWFDSGRYDVTFTTAEKAAAAIAENDEACAEAEREDEDEDI